MIIEHNGYSIEAFATQSNRQWAVRMTVTCMMLIRKSIGCSVHMKVSHLRMTQKHGD